MSQVEHATRLIDACDQTMSPYYSYACSRQVFGRELKVGIFDETKEVTHFSISWMPGNPKIVFFHNVAVDPSVRNRGLGDMFHKIRLAIAHRFGATTALCTVRVANSVERRILERNGWSIIFSVSDDVILWGRPLGNRGR